VYDEAYESWMSDAELRRRILDPVVGNAGNAEWDTMTPEQQEWEDGRHSRRLRLARLQAEIVRDEHRVTRLWIAALTLAALVLCLVVL
jgi:hypothetical protein